ncbi:MAG: condensation domain-containing protein, partial [Actinobacteria bacterium]|nr:condensation domain-containing protein [Actinomycetota bacterium]
MVAYVVPRADDVVDSAGLRVYLTTTLPDYMVPSAFVTLDELPLSRNGKLDRKALPAPEQDGTSEVGYVAPRTPTEQVLADIWAQVLGVQRVGVQDNFFELGGDSILSIQVVSRARQAGLRLSTKDIFLRQSVAELVVGVQMESAPDPLEDPVVVGPVALTPIQHWFFETETDHPDHFTMSMFVELVEDLDHDALARSVDAVVGQHEALRTRFAHIDGQWRQDIGVGEPVEVFERCDLSGLGGADQQIAMEEAALTAQTGLDIRTGPLVRMVLFTLGSGCAPRLFVTVHHLVVDGVSWRVLFEDLETAYRQTRAGQPMVLEPVGSSFRQWARRLGEYVRSGGLDEDLAYWTDVSPRAAADLPVDRTGSNTVWSSRAVSVRLGRTDTDALLRQVPGVYRTQVNDVLLAALGRVLSRWTGREKVAVALEGHGREEILDRVELSRM